MNSIDYSKPFIRNNRWQNSALIDNDFQIAENKCNEMLQFDREIIMQLQFFTYSIIPYANYRRSLNK